MKLPAVWLVGSAVLVAAVSIAAWRPWSTRPLGDPDDATLVTEGRALYADHCASCHGAQLEGQANWRRRLPSGRLPAPPHDPSGHTWHHPDEVLFGMVKHGVGPYTPPGYESDMPAFDQILTDSQIWAVLAFIKSTWPKDVRERQNHAKPGGRDDFMKEEALDDGRDDERRHDVGDGPGLAPCRHCSAARRGRADQIPPWQEVSRAVIWR